jgi:hypothetical protein
MAVKKAAVVAITGSTVYCMVKREANGKLLDDVDGGFRTDPTDPYLIMVEDPVIKGRYNFSENRTIWVDGSYSVMAYRQHTSSADPSIDLVLGIKGMYVKNNTEVIVEQNVSSINWDRLIPTISVDISQVIGE